MYLLRWLYSGLFILLFLGACENDQNGTHNDRKIIHTDRAPEAVGPYSQAVQAGNMLFLAGQVGLNPETGELAGDDLEAQTRQALQNIQAVLEAAGFTLREVTDVQVYLADMDDYGLFNEIYASWFGQSPPARALVEVSRLPLDAKVEIKVTAVKQSD